MTPICDVRSHTGAGASYRRTRFLYSLAADAVARLRVGLAREAEQRSATLLHACDPNELGDMDAAIDAYCEWDGAF